MMAKPLLADVQQITVRKPDPHCQKSSPELEARGIRILQ